MHAWDPTACPTQSMFFVLSWFHRAGKTPEAANGRQIAREAKDGRGSFTSPALSARGLAETLLVLCCPGPIDCKNL